MKTGFLTRLRLARLLARPALSGAREVRRRSRRGARAVLLGCALAVVALHAGMVALVADPRVRDPEYGRRLARLRDRAAENPGRPLVVVVGSSRVTMGVRAAAWEETRPADPARPDPLLFNLGIVGAGSVMELVALNRLFAHGVRPDAVLIEYWPPFLLSERQWDETARVSPGRMMDCDRPVVRDHFPDPGRVEAEMDRRRWNPVSADRDRLTQLLPGGLGLRPEGAFAWQRVDPWGWVPALDPAETPGVEPDWREKVAARVAASYRPLFAAHRISPGSDRALREAVALARANGAAVALLYLPESAAFRRLYPPRVERAAAAHLAALRGDLGVSVIDCREWMPEGRSADGYHLTPTGAAEFTRRLGPAVAEFLRAAGR